MLALAASRMCRPLPTEPVMETMRVSGCARICVPTVVPRPASTLMTPFGKMPATSSPRARVVSGVWAEGFSTTVLPAATAGASFQAAIMSG